MNLDPLRRRYGHGAARLAVGHGHAGPSLARIARAPVAHERAIAIVPTLLCALLAWSLIQLTAHREQQRFESEALAAAGAVRVEWDDDVETPVPAVEELAVVEPPVEAQPESPSLAGPGIPPSSGEATESGLPEQEAAAPPPDWSQLVTGAPALPPVDFEVASSGSSGTQLARPGFDDRRQRDAPDLGREWTAGSKHSAVREAPGDLEAFGRGEGRASSDVRGRQIPAVAAAPPEELLRPTARSGGHGPLTGSGAPGWQEVPLDSLPDCSPPGRQDRLKQRILATAPAGAGCRGASREFRFVETRNLNAFLLYSRARGASVTHGFRDACQVLEAALACLAGSDAVASRKELPIR